MNAVATKWVIVILVLQGVLLNSTRAANAQNPRLSGIATVKLRNQDAALSLLLEALQQVQSSAIQSDYDSQIRAANSLPDAEARRTVANLADIERYLRSRKLRKQVGNLAAAYEYARKDDEREAGVAVTSAVDLATAANKLKEFHFIQGALPLDETSFVMSVFSSDSVASTQASLPIDLQKPMSLLSRPHRNDDTLAAVVGSPLDQRVQRRGSVQVDPDMIAISYRKRDGNATNVVVHLFEPLNK
jgi:hypothetical protein